MTKPKECINSKCKNIFYVKDSELQLPLQCETCANKNNHSFDIQKNISIEEANAIIIN